MMNDIDDMSHTIEISINGNYVHGPKQHVSVVLSGDGGLDHFIEAFKTALVAAGFAMDTVKKLDDLE